MADRKGTIPLQPDVFQNVQYIDMINDLLTSFGRIKNATNGQYLIHDGTEFTASTKTSEIKIGSFTRLTTLESSTQAVTGVGFAPEVVIFFAGEDASDEFSVGFDDGTNKGSFGLNAGNYRVITTHSIYDYQVAGALYQGKVNSMDSDGFTIGWTKTGSPIGTLTVLYLALKL